MPTRPGFRNQTGSSSEDRCELNFPASSAGGAEAAQAQTQSPSQSTDGIKAVRKE